MSIDSALYVCNLNIQTECGKLLLERISFSIPSGSFVIILGLSGCGKSTLVKSLAGLHQPSQGTILYSGNSIRDIKKEFPLAIGYLPQFGISHSELTVREMLNYTSALRLPLNVSKRQKHLWIDNIVSLSNISHLLDQKYSTLSGGQMRRISLSEELLGNPAFLLLDELTTGLDAFSDGELMRWLRTLATCHNKTILQVTHSTENLEPDDQIMLLHEGKLFYHGSYSSLLEGYKASHVKEVYNFLLASKECARLPIQNIPAKPNSSPLQVHSVPNSWNQFLALCSRQATLFFRDKGQLISQLALIIIFPLLVTIFASDGLPQVKNLGVEFGGNIIASFKKNISVFRESAETSSLVSGLVMLQVILLTLLGANNGAREIARENKILKKELFAGLSPTGYIFSKFSQALILCIFQAFWMTLFVKVVCGFPGSFSLQFGALLLTTLAMSSICLAISAAAPSAERASLLSIYLVGFQLPLSGAALPLPEPLFSLTRPFIAAYWGWSGYLRSLDGSRYFSLISDTTKTGISSYSTSVVVLCFHIAIGLIMTLLFVKRKTKSR